MDIDYNEILLQAVDTLITKRIQSINYDNTQVYTILNATKAEQGEYLVTDGAVQFYAYSTMTNYKKGDSVYVTIPNNDFNEQKIIVGKKVAGDSTPFVFTKPFDTIIDTTTNLILGDTGVVSLIANNPNNEWNSEKKKSGIEWEIWSKNFLEDSNTAPLSGYTRLGLQAKFKSWLRDFKPVDGEYGLRLELICRRDMTNSKEAIYNSILEKIKNNTESDWQWILNSSGEKWFNEEKSYKDLTQDDKKLIETKTKYLLAEQYEQINLILNSYNMYGSPYAFDTYYQQEAVYDISSINQILKMRLVFYQKPGSFIKSVKYEPISISENEYKSGKYYIEKDLGYDVATGNFDKNIIYYKKIAELIPYKDEATDNLFLPNLFEEEPYICLGYNLKEFDKESVILYSVNNTTYSPSEYIKEETNNKVIQLRWIHANEGGNIISVSPNNNELEYEVRWYKKSLGSPKADFYSGVDWEFLDTEKHSFSYTLKPNVLLPYEQIKAIIIYNNKPLYSNVLTFTNENPVADSKTIEVNTSLYLECQDNSSGNYLIYDQGNRLLDISQSSINRKLAARFIEDVNDINSNRILTEATYIEWRIPSQYTMLKLSQSYGIDYNNLNKLESYKSPKLITNWGDPISYTYDDAMKKEYQTTINYIGYRKIMYDANKKEIVICWKGDTNNANRINYMIDYTIASYYTSAYTYNTITCIIEKNKQIYKTALEFTFGVAGTTGTNYTLVIDFDNNETALTAGNPKTVSLKAKLYDQANQEITEKQLKQQNIRWLWCWHKDTIGGNETQRAKTDNLLTSNVFYTLTEDTVINTSKTYYIFDKNDTEDYIIVNNPIKEDLDLKKYYEKYSILDHLSDLTINGDNDKTKVVNYDSSKPGVGIIAYSGNDLTMTNHIALTKLDKLSLSDNDNLPFLLLQVTLIGWGKYPLSAVLPIPVRAEEKYSHILGATTVFYPSLGEMSYSTLPYKIFIKNKDKFDEGKGKWEFYNPYNEASQYTGQIVKYKEEYRLQPAKIYTKNTHQYGCYFTDEQKKVNGKNVDVVKWIQPIFISQNNYPCGALNAWDGKSLEINEDEGTILSRGLSAGKKDSKNRFSGVILGDWSSNTAQDISGKTGIYGLNHGQISYALTDDGKFLLGKAGSGRIIMDGNKSTIESCGYRDGGQGVRIDLDGSRQGTGSQFISIRGYSGVSTKLSDIDKQNSKIIKDSGKNGYGYKLNPILAIGDGISNNYLQSASYPDGQGVKIDLNKGRLDAKGDFNLTANGDQVVLSTSSPYLQIKDSCNSAHTLIYMGDDDYYLQSCDYAWDKTGVKLDLKNGKLEGYNFTIKAKNDEDTIIITSDKDKNPLTIGNNFSVTWDGSITASNVTVNSGTFTGAIYAGSGNIGGWTINSNCLQSSDTKTTLYSDGRLEMDHIDSVIKIGNWTINQHQIGNPGGTYLSSVGDLWLINGYNNKIIFGNGKKDEKAFVISCGKGEQSEYNALTLNGNVVITGYSHINDYLYVKKYMSLAQDGELRFGGLNVAIKYAQASFLQSYVEGFTKHGITSDEQIKAVAGYAYFA